LALGLAGAALAPDEARAVGRALALAAGFLALRATPRLLVPGAVALALVLHHADSYRDGTLHLSWAKLSTTPHAPGSAERLDLAAFIERETPLDARLLIPPEERLLPYLCGRSVVATAGYAVLGPLDVRAGRAELERLEAIGYRFGDPQRAIAYHAWPPDRIRAVARSLGATHVVIDRELGDPPLGSPLHENARFKLYILSP
jgi:hypothetical protein